MRRWYMWALLLPCCPLVAQPQLPGFPVADTLSRPCIGDTATSVLSFVRWEAYQTLDDFWDGPRDPDICIELATVAPSGWVYPRIAVDQIHSDRPVFLRVLFDEDFVLPLSPDNQYIFSFDIYSNSGWDIGDCPGGPCTGLMAAVRIPDATGTGTDLRWYDAPYQQDPWAPFPLNVCVPTEKFSNNDLREFIVSMKPLAPQPGQYIQGFWSDVIDQDQWGTLFRITPQNLAQFRTGPALYTFEGWGFENYLVMHADTTYPDDDHVFHLDLGPVPDPGIPTEVNVQLMPYTGFNFQPYTQLRGGLVMGSDSLHHPLTVENLGADLCLGWQIVELFWEDGDRYLHREGHLDFAGRMSCFMFKPGSTLEVAAGSTLYYGREGRGMLALLQGSHLRIGSGGDLVMQGTLVIMEPPGTTEPGDFHVRLGPGERLRFAPGSRIHNANSIDGRMQLVVTLDGGSIDISGLSPEDRPKVVVVELPKEKWTDLRVLGNPARDELVLSFAVREEGPVVLRAFDALGRRVLDRVVAVVPGENRLSLPLHGLRQGAYILEASHGGVRQVLRFVKE